MNKKSLKIKIFFIFLIPSIAIVYFSYLSLEHQYQKLEESSTLKLSANITKALSDLIYHIQIERGLSSGYIISKDKIQSKLLSSYKETDKALQILKQIINKNIHQDNALGQVICTKARPLIIQTINKMKNISNIRDKVLNSTISFHDEIQYYSSLNAQLILSIKMINKLFYKIQEDAQVVVLLETLQEYAGLERAYTYNQLLSSSFSMHDIERLKELKELQTKIMKEFLFVSSEKSISVYKKYHNENIEKKLSICRNGVIHNKLSAKDAAWCFDISTRYINSLKQISTEVLDGFIQKSNAIYEQSIRSLYITYLLWFFSFFALMVLSFFIRRFINNEYNNLQQLRVASYAFDSQEAMVITDTDRVIIKVNAAFTEITGYKDSEAIGKKLDILQTDIYNNFFYRRIFAKLRKNGKWHGEVYNKKKNGEIYPEMLSITAIKNDNGITTHYIAQFTDISEIKKAQEIAEHQADHDFLTGILNRKSLLQRLNEEFVKAKRHHFTHAFLFIDLDNFKSINDNYGHDAGDKLIIEVTKRLTSMLREGDIVARISGDEFAVMLLNLNSDAAQAAKTVQNICEKILKKISKKFLFENYTIKVSSSIGVKMFPDSKESVNDVIIHADKAMYEAKKKGRNQLVFFDEKIAHDLQKFAILEVDIKKSLKNNHFVFFFQPKVCVKTGEIRGAEMLIRWIHPQKGLLFPGSFIDAAESMGVIHKFSILALENACTFLQENQKFFSGSLAINISSKELLHPNFEHEVISIIKSYEIDPSKIELEITESMIIKEFDLVVQKIAALQSFGIKFSIDDFGTGYSSITYLQKLPVNTLKIDRSFFSNLDLKANKELVKMVINIAKTFDMEVVSEGIENDIQLAFIQEHGSNLYQGFYFSKAIDKQSFIDLLHTNSSLQQ